MTELSFEFDWESPEGAHGPELQATWARFAITVNHEPVTRLFDHKSRTVRESIYLPLYPLAEWLATNWWLLNHETLAPWRKKNHEYEQNHSLRFAGEGFALPDLVVEPQGMHVKLSWQAYKHPFAPLEFINSGIAHIERAQFQEACTSLIECVLKRLDEIGIESSLLKEEWAAIQNADEEEQDFCRVAGALGLDPYSINETDIDALTTVAEQLPVEIQDEFFSTANPLNLRQEAKNVSDIIQLLQNRPAENLGLRDFQGLFSSTVRDPSEAPWNTGYQIAREFRKQLAKPSGPAGMEPPLDKLQNLSDEGYRAQSNDTQLLRIDAIIAYQQDATPQFFIPQKNKKLRLFALYRGLFEILTASQATPALITRSKTERQKSNRAFAAEFLVPAENLRERVKTDTIGDEEIEELAEDFQVSTTVIRYQLVNHNIATLLPESNLFHWW